jgi:D-alanyl-D-alanine dipeptidase
MDLSKTPWPALTTALLLCGCASTKPPVQTATTAQAGLIAAPIQPRLEQPIQIISAKAEDIVNLQNLSQLVQVNMAYAGADNFTGAVVPGYQTNSCYLQKKAAQALVEVAKQASLLGYRLQLLDCYRPHSTSAYFMNWVADLSAQHTKTTYYPNIEKSELSQGYIAAKSGHSRASTVDLTLLQKDASGQWHALDMGGRYDLFDPVSHLNSTAISTTQKANRLLLKDLMQQQGFIPYAMEWWHFTLKDEVYPHSYFDFPVH